MVVPAAVIVQVLPGAAAPNETPVDPSLMVYDPCTTLNEAEATPLSRATRSMGAALPGVLPDPPVAVVAAVLPAELPVPAVVMVMLLLPVVLPDAAAVDDGDAAPVWRGAPRQVMTNANRHSSNDLQTWRMANQLSPEGSIQAKNQGLKPWFSFSTNRKYFLHFSSI
jgi:hypothetical protein